MEPLLIDLKKLTARVRRIEKRISSDPRLVSVVRECGRKIDSVLSQHQQLT